ncbi:hypothetical protein TIFTF001_013604 [Ficus carica]|uniref:Diacylglycerol O-acyltransferase n=1 Tax=Ficus carica TaxID=3494 RepID=A0AA88A2C7_FICCA|nr:hypothetical protein TIFTF001_013604 [Ficus carica]
MEMKYESEELQKMKLSPAARLFQSPRFNCHIVSLIGCTTSIDPDVIKHGLTHTLLKHPRFSSKLVVDDNKFWRRRRWVRTSVNLNDHVFAPTLDSKIDDPDQFVQDYISHLTTTPLDLSRPPWELHVLNLKTSDSESLGIFRIHHSVGDGASLMSLLLACTRRTSDPDALPTLPAPIKPPTPPPDEGGFAARFLRFLAAIWSAIVMIWNTVVDVTVFGATILFLSDTKTPIKGPPGVERSTKRFAHRSQNEKDVGRNKKTNYLPKKIRLNSTILVNLRPTVGIQALADMMAKNSKAKWGNLLGYLLLPFNIALQDDPLDYVRQAKAIMDRKKHSYEAPCTYFCARLLQKVVGDELTAATARRAISNTTLAFSNMIGPLEEVSFYGHQIAYLAPSVYGHPHALTIHFQSYVDKMTIVLAVDPNVISDPQCLFDDFEESLKLIREAVVKQGLNKETV